MPAIGQTGALPAGLSMTSGGNITGTPTAAGTFVSTITVRDSASRSRALAYTFNVLPPPSLTLLESTYSIVQKWSVAQPVSYTCPSAACTFTLAAGAPGGLKVSSTATGAGGNTVAVTGTTGTVYLVGAITGGPNTYTVKLTPTDTRFNRTGTAVQATWTVTAAGTAFANVTVNRGLTISPQKLNYSCVTACTIDLRQPADHQPDGLAQRQLPGHQHHRAAAAQPVRTRRQRQLLRPRRPGADRHRGQYTVMLTITDAAGGRQHQHRDLDGALMRIRIPEEARERGTSMMEVIVGMGLMTVFMAIFTSTMFSVYRASSHTESVVVSSGQLNAAFLKLDKLVRYASAISTPSSTANAAGNYYVEIQTTNSGSTVCSQLRLNTATKVLSQRSWRVPSAGTCHRLDVVPGAVQRHRGRTGSRSCSPPPAASTSSSSPSTCSRPGAARRPTPTPTSPTPRSTATTRRSGPGQIPPCRTRSARRLVGHDEARFVGFGGAGPVRSLRGQAERGSLPMAMLVMLVGIGLSAAFAPMAINQRKATTFDMARVHALNAAQAGMDVTVGKIRAAIGSQGGDPTKLPCTVSTDQSTALPVTGAVGTGAASYSVMLQYYVSDPVAHPGAVPMRCVSGYGTYDTASGSVVPSYVKITSIGTDGSSANGGTQGRTLTAVYSFDVDNSNISGGIIRSYPASADGSAQWCLDVGSGTPTAGVTQVSLQPCSTSFPPDPQQVFAYRTDLTLQLTTSIGTVVNGVTYRNGLCIDDVSFNGARTAPASGTALVLKQCGALGSPIWSQQWSFDDHSSLQAPTSSSASTGSLSGLCMTVTSHSAGVPVKLGACDNNLTSPTDAWIPSPAVGAGAATLATSNQWINFQQFGRCINVPNSDPNAVYIIAPSCKQNPRQASVAPNQKLFYDSTRKWFYLTLSGTNWCLYSSNTAYVANSTVGRILVTRCTSPASGISASQMQWIRTTPATDPTLSYSQQYRFSTAPGCACRWPPCRRCPGTSTAPPIRCGRSWSPRPATCPPCSSGTRPTTSATPRSRTPAGELRGLDELLNTLGC